MKDEEYENQTYEDADGFSIIGSETNASCDDEDGEEGAGKRDETAVGGFTGGDTDIPEPKILNYRAGADTETRFEKPRKILSTPDSTNRTTLDFETTRTWLSMSTTPAAASVLLNTEGMEENLDALRSAPANPSDERRRPPPTTTTTTDEGERSFLAPIRDVVWVVRIATSTTRRFAGYSLRSGVRTGTRMIRAASTSRTLDDFIAASQEIAFEEMDRLGVDVGQEDTNGRRRRRSVKRSRESAAELRERGTRLLEMSADVEHDELVHPAYSHILDQLAPDEARILRFLVTEGPQPTVDIRNVGWLPISSELVGAGMSMIGTEAGCRYEDRTQAYLNNLKRLGLIWFSDEPVEDIGRYQLVEAQSDIKDAIDSCKRAKVIRRSVHLTPFGVDFCRICLPVDTISDDASSVYNPPDYSKHRDQEEDSDSDQTPWSRDKGQREEANFGSLSSDIRNPHVDDHWEEEA